MPKVKISDYWINRAKERQLEDLRDSDEVIKLVNEQFENCLKKIEKEIAMIFYRFSENNEIDYDLAIKLLTGKEYIKFKRELAEYMEMIDNPNILLELNTLSARSRISRLEQSFFEIQKHIDGVFQFTDEKVEGLLYESTKSNYFKTLFDISVASEVTVKNLNVLSKAEIVKEFAKPWSGKNFSERIWKNRTLLKDTLEEIIIQSAIQGVDTEDAIDKITKKIDVSKKAAATLIHTEQAYFSGLGTKKAYEVMNVQKYIFIATLDFRTSDTCRELDHEIYQVSEAQAGVNYPPMHPRCRSATAPYTGKLEGTRTARDKDGNEVKVDKSLNYKEWYKQYVESNPEYLIEENKWKNRHRDKKQFEKYKNVGVRVPKSFDNYQDLKYNESERDRRLRSVDYTRRMKLKNNPELKLPNVDTATIDKNKFEKYLFGGNNVSGLNKGKLIEKRLGYNIDNYKEFEKDILKKAKENPVVNKGSNGHVTRYEQKIIMYNKDGIPTNVKVGWGVDKDKTHLTTVIIEEVK